MKQDRRIYIVVRTDIPDWAIAPQACHAVVELGRNEMIRRDESHPTLVVLAVNSLEELRRVFLSAREFGIRCQLWAEEDFGNTETAFATEAIPATMREPFKSLRLLSPAAKADPRHSDLCGCPKGPGDHFLSQREAATC